jgi:hypothetical protein
MHTRTQAGTAILILLAGTCGPAFAADNDAMIKSALSAAPAAVGKDASVMIGDGKGGMVTAKTGTNGFICMPDDPGTPGNDPMCLDQNSMLWIQAYMTHATPPDGKVGIGYMLQGDSQASNLDPYATTPAAGNTWVVDGPHMMIFNSLALNAAYPHDATLTPDVTHPYVMFPGTPYAHLMVPVAP